MKPAEVHDLCQRVSDSVSDLFVSTGDQVTMVLIAFLAAGHVLIEDVPGVGKTTLARALARTLGLSLGRIQFTPDVMPSDVTGIHIYNESTARFDFQPGPVHHQLVLADEINRTPPKTQSSLLEAMQERQVTIDGETIALPQPFLVIATQNPVEHDGTYPLPVAQLDRFAIRVSLGYPSAARERQLLDRFSHRNPWSQLEPVAAPGEILAAQAACREIHVATEITDYIINLVQATREDSRVRLGASPRASLTIQQLAMAAAASEARPHVLPDDVKRVFFPALNHRLLLEPEYEWQEDMVASILSDILDSVTVPATALARRS